MGSKSGKSRAFGYTSVHVDEATGKETYMYTRFEKDGSVNRYIDNGEGGHAHERWRDKNDFIDEMPADWKREAPHPNPPEGDVKGGCYLTTACMQHYKKDFDDNCYELTMLRWFRDTLMKKEDVMHYYRVAPTIVDCISREKYSEVIFEKIYKSIILPCVKAIEVEDYYFAYKRYKETVLAFEQKYIKDKEREDCPREIQD